MPGSTPAEIEDGARALTQALYRLSPAVEASGLDEEPGVFWLDADGLLLLHPSLDAWAEAVRAAVRAEGLAGAVAVGFSRFGSYATARALAGRGQVVWGSAADEHLAVARVPLHRVGIDPATRDALAQLGVHTVGQLAKLPEAGLLRRFGVETHRLHQRAAGARLEPLTPVAPERRHVGHVDFDDPIADREALLFFGKQLLDPLLVELAGVGHALREMTLTIASSPPRVEVLRPAAPTLDAAQLLGLLRLRLELVTLEAGARELTLEAIGHPATREQLELFAATNASRPRDRAAADRALARVRAAFGDGAVVRARLRSGHLPEASFAWEPLLHVAPPRPRKVLERPLVRRVRARPTALPARPPREPDGWLLRGLPHGPVARLHGPFCLSGGWWNALLQRDYYYAELARGGLCWIYYDRRRRGWFLHGEVA